MIQGSTRCNELGRRHAEGSHNIVNSSSIHEDLLAARSSRAQRLETERAQCGVTRLSNYLCP